MRRARDITAFIAVIVFTILSASAIRCSSPASARCSSPGKANGSLIKRNGVVVGSALIGQQFDEPVIGKNGKPVLDERQSGRRSPTRATSRRRPSADRSPAVQRRRHRRSRTSARTTRPTETDDLRATSRPTWG